MVPFLHCLVIKLTNPKSEPNTKLSLIGEFRLFTLYIFSADRILYRFETRYPTGALWILNRVGFFSKYNVLS